MTIQLLTSDQTAQAVSLVKAYDKATASMQKALASQSQSGVEFIAVVSPAIVSIYQELSNDGALIGKRTAEASELSGTIAGLLESVGLKPHNSLSKNTIAICSNWFLASIKLGAEVTPLTTILENAETMKGAKGSIEEMAPKAPQTPEAMVQAFIERFTKAHPETDLVALVFDTATRWDGVAIAEAKTEKVAA